MTLERIVAAEEGHRLRLKAAKMAAEATAAAHEAPPFPEVASIAGFRSWGAGVMQVAKAARLLAANHEAAGV